MISVIQEEDRGGEEGENGQSQGEQAKNKNIEKELEKDQ